MPNEDGPENTLGVVLAGGLGQRMGGGDKPLRCLNGVSLLDRVLDVLRPQVDTILLNANGSPERFLGWNLPVVQDDVPGHLGPLAGVLAGLNWASAYRPDLAWVLTVPGDSPFLPGDLVARLHAARTQAGLSLACAASGGRSHPPVALWPVSLRADLRAAILAGERKVDRWTGRHGCATANWGTEPLNPFFNVNTPADLAEAEALARRTTQPYQSAGKAGISGSA